MALKILCFVKLEINTIGISVKGSNSFLICSSNSLIVLVFLSTKSHLLTRITMPLLFLAANQKIFLT